MDTLFESVLHQMLRYFLWGRDIPPVEVTLQAQEGGIALAYESQAVEVAGSVPCRGYFDALESLRKPLREVLGALGPFDPPFEVGLNLCSQLGGPRWRPVGSELLTYSILPITCELHVEIAERLQSEGRSEEALEIWLQARHLFQLSGAPAMSLGNLQGIQKDPHVQSYLAAHDPRALRLRLVQGFCGSSAEAPNGGARGAMEQFFETPSPPFERLSQALRTHSVVKAMKAYHRFFFEHLEDRVSLVELARSIEWLIDHDTDEEKNIRKLVPPMRELLFEALEHQSPFVRKRYRAVGGVWLNEHLLELPDERALAARVFEHIVDDCALLRLFAVGGGLEDRPGIADVYAGLGDGEAVRAIERYDVFAVKERQQHRFRRWRAEAHFGPELPEPHPSFQ